MINNAVIMGRICEDLELRTTASGTSVTSFTVAVDRRFQKQGEEKQTDFLTVVCWKSTADFVCRYFHKGSMIAVQGSIQTRNYEDKNGNKRTAVEIVADNVSFCGSKAENGTQETSYTPTFQSASQGDFESIDDDDDSLPF
jgi:single-strand DNA-binding protein